MGKCNYVLPTGKECGKPAIVSFEKAWMAYAIDEKTGEYTGQVRLIDNCREPPALRCKEHYED